jgi:hypothetical protein
MFNHEKFDTQFRVAKSHIERNESQLVTKIVLRNGRWPEYKGFFTHGTEWVVFGRTIVVNKVRKRAIESKTINIATIKKMKLTLTPWAYHGNLSFTGEPGIRETLQFNMEDMFVAYAVCMYIQDHRPGAVEHGDLKLNIASTVVEARKHLDAGTLSQETMNTIKERNMSY